MVPWTRGDPHLLCLCVQDLWRLPHGADGCERRAGLRGLFAQGHQFAVDRALRPRAHAGAGNHFQADPVLQARRPAPVRCLWAAARAAGVTGAGGSFLTDMTHARLRHALRLVLNWVPLPVIQTCRGNMSWCWPAGISSQVLTISL